MRGEWDLVWRLGLTFRLSAAIGLERELRQKSAGLRTHTLVGVGSALFTPAGAYGFADVIDPQHVLLDPSRVAAQVVSGIGFIGGGLIFVRRDAVRGGRGVLREALARCTGAGFAVADISTRRLPSDERAVSLRLELHGRDELEALAVSLGELDGVLAVDADRPDDAV